MIILGIVLGLGAASLAGFIWYSNSVRPRLQAKAVEQEGLRKQAQILCQVIEEYQTQRDNLGVQILKKSDELKSVDLELSQRSNTLTNLKQEVSSLEAEKRLLIEHLDQMEINAKQTADAIYDNMQNSLAIAAEKLGENYQEKEEEYAAEYQKARNDFVKDIAFLVLEKKEELAKLQAAIEECASKVASAVEENKRAKEMAEKQDFYRVVISKEDQEEIAKLKSVAIYLRDPTALYKVIWKVYYENPTSDMIGRVLGDAQKTGVYKITNLKNQMSYVGQAVCAQNRWRQHIRRGLGAEPSTRNKLYPAMFEEGVENFSFELIEECAEEELDEREDFWQDFFKAKTFGYSIK